MIKIRTALLGIATFALVLFLILQQVKIRELESRCQRLDSRLRTLESRISTPGTSPFRLLDPAAR